MKKHNKYAVMGFNALQRATRKVLEHARRNDQKVPIWRNERIEFEIPELIAEHLEGLPESMGKTSRQRNF